MRFPNTEAEIGKLARFMISGLRSQQEIFPALGGARPKATSMRRHRRCIGVRGIATAILDILVWAWIFDIDLPLRGDVVCVGDNVFRDHSQMRLRCFVEARDSQSDAMESFTAYLSCDSSGNEEY